jgi:hypothetical protein
MEEKLKFVIDGPPDEKTIFKVRKMINLGRTSRNPEDIMKHLEELKKAGIKVSPGIPSYNPKISDRITTGNKIEALPNSKTSGEVEYVLLFTSDSSFYVTVGSDHTDRELEKSNVVLSKQICLNVISPRIWRYEEVKNHWDDIIMKAWIKKDDKRQLYQEGKLGEMLRPEELIEKVRLRVSGDLTGMVIYSGTFPIIGGELSFSPYFEVELIDEHLKRQIQHVYNAKPITWFK